MLTYFNTYDGPFDLELLVYNSEGADTSQYARTNIKNEALNIVGNFEQKERLLGDGSKCYWLEGSELIIEIQLSEVNPVASSGDIAKILASDLLTLDFDDPERLMTVGALGTIGSDNIKVDLVDNGMKITIKHSGYIGQDWSDMFTMPLGSLPE